MDEHEASEAPDTRGPDGDGLEPVTVWLVSRETGQLGWQGTLTLESETLAFRPEDGGAPRVYQFDQIRKVHRVLGSPVLESAARPDGPAAAGGLLLRPAAEPRAVVEEHDAPALQKRTARKRAILTLRAANDRKVEDIRTWVGAIRRAMGAQRGRR